MKLIPRHLLVLVGLFCVLIGLLGARSLAAQSATPEREIYPEPPPHIVRIPVEQLPSSEQPLTELLFAVPVGETGIHYEAPGLPDSETWGPTALAVGPDGKIWIADTVAVRLLAFAPDGQLSTALSLEGLAVGVADLKVTNAGLWIFDTAAQPTQLTQLDPNNGQLIAREEVNSDMALSAIGLTVNGDGTAGVLTTDDLQLLNDKPQGESSAAPDEVGEPVSAFGQRADVQTVVVDGQQLQMPAFQETGAYRLLGRAADGSLFLIVEDVVTTDVIRVDQTVRRYSADGTYMGSARFPLDAQYTYVERNLALAPDGTVYALLTRPDGVEVHKLLFYDRLKAMPWVTGSQTPDTSNAIPAVGDSPQAPACTISRDQIMSNAAAYVNNSMFLSNTNVNGACTGRGKPRYLGGEGTYLSVPYDWGGKVSVSQFRSEMSAGRQAGDINTAGVESCSSGVDCSGFIARVWQLSGNNWYTGNLPDVGTRLNSTADLQRGDILNINSSSNAHVALFASKDATTVTVYESTTYNSRDQVIYYRHSWSRYNGYAPYRLRELCVGDTDDNRTISNGQTLNGTISPNNDTDTYYFDATQSQRATIRMNKNGSSLDSYLILYGPNGAEITRNDDSGGNYNSLINNVALTQSGRYRLVASSYGGYSGGAYTLSLQLINNVNYTPPSGYTFCAYENQRCSFSDRRDVAYGANGVFTYRYGITGGIDCTNGVFGDPLNGVVKACYTKSAPLITNLAKNRVSNAWSQESSSFAPRYGNDGNQGTRWSSGHSSTQNQTQWWWVDLGAQRSFNQVKINWEAAYATSYFIGWSDAPNCTGTYSGYNYTRSSSGWATHNLGNRYARCIGIKMSVKRSGMANYSFWELEAYNLVARSSGALPTLTVDDVVVDVLPVPDFNDAQLVTVPGP